MLMQVIGNADVISNPGIYRIVNRENGRIYIGSTINLKQRFYSHRKDLRAGRHHSGRLQNAFNKYGEQQFLFEPLILCAKSDLLMYEQVLIDEFKPFYNIAKVAGSRLGVPTSSEARKKQSDKKLGTRLSERHKDNIRRGLRGQPKSDDHKVALKMAWGKRDRRFSDGQLRLILGMSAEGLSQTAIADHFGVTQSTISRILGGQRYVDFRRSA
jgi:group I intron endonuclease